jgi:hypothetical protein
MNNISNLLLMAIEATPHHGITLTNGEYHEGYLLDFNDDWVEFGEGGPLADYSQSVKYRIYDIEAIWYDRDGEYKAFMLIEKI